jgi:multiple sugar transport system ATP-binding protein
MATLELKNIDKAFGAAKVLHDISLAIEDQEFVVFVGPSGCGKSTLLRIIAGLEEATSGQIMIGDADVSALAPIDRGISMVFQSYALYPHLTVFENIAFPLRVQGLGKDALNAKVARAAKILQLEDKLQLKPGQLSGGQRQRVAIGRSIVREPTIFLFDEPLSNLDAALRGDMRVELSELHKQLNTTMVYVTHDQVEAMTMADRIVVLKDGQIEQFGTPMELYHHPRTRFVASFIGQPNMNFLTSKVTKASAKGVTVTLPGNVTVALPLNGTTVSVGDKIDVGLRPEHLTVQDDGQIEVRVNILERLGGLSITYSEIDGERFCSALDGAVHVREDTTIRLRFDPAAAHAFDAHGNVLARLAAPKHER